MGKAWKFEDNLNTDEIIPAQPTANEHLLGSSEDDFLRVDARICRTVLVVEISGVNINQPRLERRSISDNSHIAANVQIVTDKRGVVT